MARSSCDPATLPRLLVSACLLGQPVRYDGAAKAHGVTGLDVWQRAGRIVPICPELAAGFGVPRLPAEIGNGANGADVLAGTARVIEQGGRDVTALYIAGAEAALDLARTTGCALALLTDGSPSCGSGFIHDGSFGGVRHAGSGVTAALLQANGIRVIGHDDLDSLPDP